MRWTAPPAAAGMGATACALAARALAAAGFAATGLVAGFRGCGAAGAPCAGIRASRAPSRRTSRVGASGTCAGTLHRRPPRRLLWSDGGAACMCSKSWNSALPADPALSRSVITDGLTPWGRALPTSLRRAARHRRGGGPGGGPRGGPRIGVVRLALVDHDAARRAAQGQLAGAAVDRDGMGVGRDDDDEIVGDRIAGGIEHDETALPGLVPKHEQLARRGGCHIG